MNKRNILLILLVPFVFIVSCGKGDEDEIEISGSSTLTVTGAEPATITDNGAEFTYTISSVSGGEISDLTINMGNYGTTATALQIKLSELDNTTGYDETTYNYLPESTTFFFTSIYVTDNNSYSIKSGSELTNSLTITEISDEIVKGTFEVNLESFDGDQIKLTGSFEAVGETLTL